MSTTQQEIIRKATQPCEPKPNTVPPIKSGWRGNLNGVIERTSTHIQTSEIELRIDRKTAWALCNLLCDSSRERAAANSGDQDTAMQELGAALGRLIDHPAANNGGREIVK